MKKHLNLMQSMLFGGLLFLLSTQVWSAIAVQYAHSGVWYNPNEDGHGFFLTVSQQQGQLNLVMSWYHYENGEQRYVVGSQVFDSGTGLVIVPVIRTNGTGFGNAFISTDVVRTDWGQLSVQFDSCEQGSVRYQTNDGLSGVVPIQRLAGIGILDCDETQVAAPVNPSPPVQLLVQQPFVCSSLEAGLGQPHVDNQEAGWPVYDASNSLLGFSSNCDIPVQVEYRYRSTNGEIKKFQPDSPRPNDMAMTTLSDGSVVPYVIRWERGSMNRFIYSVAALAPGVLEGNLGVDLSAWNQRLLYYFQGGTGIGHSQGDPSERRMLYDDALKLGYAVIYSTGTDTDTHYNLALGGRTAVMLKEHFISLYGQPLYTIGIGASGGGVQQYVYAQNHPGLIDAAIPQYAFPDMITQTIHIGDCELLEYYMDVTDGRNSKWSTWSNRSILEGLNASDTQQNRFLLGLRGSSGCVSGWRGLTPSLINPLWGKAEGQENMLPETIMDKVKWTHWQDSTEIYGLRADGHAPNTIDNVGVQYGLTALTEQQITPEEFLQLNDRIGGWKDVADMQQEGCPYFPKIACFEGFSSWDPWSQRNQNHSDGSESAQRTSGDVNAMRAAYSSGMVFQGDVNIPILDWRHYLEDQLNQHDSIQSFASRQRMLDVDGDASNQIIWFTDAREITEDDDRFNQMPEALAVMDQWMLNILNNPDVGVADNKPALATDRCFDATGQEIATGDDVWNGIIDDHSEGACATQFQTFSTSRIVAGAPVTGSVFKCALQSIDAAIEQHVYADWEPDESEKARLREIFPDGVCDYTQADQALF